MLQADWCGHFRGSGMALFGKILIGVDGSEPGLNALRQGCRLGRAERARIVAVSVAPRYEGDLSLVGVRNLDSVMNAPGSPVFQATQRIAQEEGVVLDHLTTSGDIAERITEVSAQHQCDLIILGYQHRPALWRLVLNSIIPTVMDESPADVLIFPQGSHFAWQDVLLAIDDPHFSGRAARRALDFARAYGARLLIAAPPAGSATRPADPSPSPAEELPRWQQRRFLQEFQQQADTAHVRTEIVTPAGRIPNAAIDQACREGIGLAILPQALLRSRWAFLGQRSAALALQRSSCPILAVHS
ncbi:MAG TPA: hypothetical protein DCE18_04050 [Syntrophobacteraceae bacterium]|nr:hypothetical protein [Syntrophobacteraceae bacterium]